jgi:hypothetical protein
MRRLELHSDCCSPAITLIDINRWATRHAHLKSGVLSLRGQAVCFAAFTLAHRARCAAAIFLRAAADIVRFLGIDTTFILPLFAFTFAHRARCAAAILALPAADILPRVLVRFL